MALSFPLQGRRLVGVSTLLSLALHVGAALIVLGLPRAGCRPETVGSDALDVDLAAPRLAPPVRVTGGDSLEGRGIGTGGVEGLAGKRGEGGSAPLAGAPRIELSAMPSATPSARGQDPRRELVAVEELRPQPVAGEARAQQVAGEARAAQRAQEQGGPVTRAPRPAVSALAGTAGSLEGLEPAALDERGDLPQRRRPERLAREAVVEQKRGGAIAMPERPARKSRLAATTALGRLFADREVEAAAPPVAAVAEVKASAAQRVQLNHHARRAQHEREARAERWLAEMNTASRFQHSEGEGAGAAAAGSGPGSGRRGEGSGAGRAPGYGLHFYLSGRPVKGDRVVRPPEAIELPRVQCRVARLDITPATVRMLVVKDGRVGIAYLKHSSSSREFDRCALGHARSIRFLPGRDGAGTPLDVWINVRVEPSALGTGGLGMK